MKTKLITTLLLFAGITYSQNEVAYTYDDAGNRIKRESNSTNMIINNNNSSEENMAVSGVALEAHPNPTSTNTEVVVIIDLATIAPEDKTAIESGVTMQLSDVTGKVLQTLHAGPNNPSPSVAFDLQGMSSGVYFVKAVTKSGKLVGERKILRE